MNVLFVYVIGTAVALGLIDLIATKWVEWHATVNDEAERHVCQHCDWFVVPTEDAICRGCVIDQFGIDPGDNYNLFQDLNPGNHGP